MSRVLVVDDDRGMRAGLETEFLRHGWRVDGAAGVGEALLRFRPSEHALVVTDLRMPDGDGLGLMRDLRARAPETAVILLTAYGSVPGAVEAVRGGACDYASAEVDQRRMGRLSWAIHLAFQEMGVFPEGQTNVPPVPLQLPFDSGATLRLPEKIPQNLAGGGSGSDDPDLSILQEQLAEQLSGEIALHSVAIHREEDGLVLSLKEFGFFESGSAEIRLEALPVLDRIASLLAIRTYRLRVEGHTDNVPVRGAKVGSNWELSSNRAAALVRMLIDRYGFVPERLSAAGFAEYHPVAPNTTKEGRAQNRRVDVVILGSRSRPADSPSP